MRINKEILNLAIPNILSNISVPLLSSVDTILMGRLSATHLGAVGLGSMIFNFIYWNFGFLRMGTTGMTAQAFGRKDSTGIANVLGRAGALSLFLTLLILLIQIPLFDSAVSLLNVTSDQVPLVGEYFYTRIWAAPATLLLYVLLGWFFGMQNAIIPMVLTIVINLVNIFVSAYLVRELNLGIQGVAMGTVVAQYFGLGIGLIFIFVKYTEYVGKIKVKALVAWIELKLFLNINRDLFIRTVMLTLAFGFFYSQSSSEGEIILAVNVVLLQFLNWMSYGIDGFAFAAESVVGKYKGNKEDASLKEAISKSFMWGFLFAALYALIYLLFGKNLVSIFTNDIKVINASLPYLWWMVVFPLFSTPSYLWDGVFIGLTASKAMRNSMTISFLLYIVSYYVLEPNFGNHGLWMALLILMVTRGVIQWWMYKCAGSKLQ
jgi:MATE family multidrug resistance protein